MIFFKISTILSYKITCGFFNYLHQNHLLEDILGTGCDVHSKFVRNETISKVGDLKRSYRNDYEEENDYYLPARTIIDFTNVTKVSRLITSEDLITFPAGIDKVFPNIFVLVLDSLGIKNIHQADFVGFPRLNELDLQTNQIDVLEKDLFKNIPLLRVLNLWGNDIKMIDANVFDGLKFLKYINLINNFCISNGASGSEVFSFIESIKLKCKPKEPSTRREDKKIEKTFNWSKYFWCILIIGTSLIVYTIYCVARMLCTVKVSPEDEKEVKEAEADAGAARN